MTAGIKTEALCPICRSAGVRLHLDDEEEALEPSLFGSSRVKIAHGRIVRCASCRFGFRERRSNPAEMAELYRQMDTGVYESETAGRKATAARHLGIVHRFTAGRGRLLDAGCASGYFLHQARQAGWSIAGVSRPRPCTPKRARFSAPALRYTAPCLRAQLFRLRLSMRSHSGMSSSMSPNLWIS